MRTIKIDKLTFEKVMQDKEVFNKIKDELLINKKEVFMQHYGIDEKTYNNIRKYVLKEV